MVEGISLLSGMSRSCAKCMPTGRNDTCGLQVADQQIGQVGPNVGLVANGRAVAIEGAER